MYHALVNLILFFKSILRFLVQKETLSSIVPVKLETCKILRK